LSTPKTLSNWRTAAYNVGTRHHLGAGHIEYHYWHKISARLFFYRSLNQYHVHLQIQLVIQSKNKTRHTTICEKCYYRWFFGSDNPNYVDQFQGCGCNFANLD